MFEILSKAKRAYNGEWVYGYPVRFGPAGHEIWNIVPEFASVLYLIAIDEKTLGRYTGLCDKNGTRGGR